MIQLRSVTKKYKNNYALKNIGCLPNISALAFVNNNLYIASRTKSRVAIIDYSTLGLISEFTTVSKPISMQIFDNNLYVLGSQENKIQKINTNNCKVVDLIDLDTNGFSVNFNKVGNTNLAVITDVKTNKYTIFDLAKGKVVKTYSINVPINDVIIADKIKLFDQ